MTCDLSNMGPPKPKRDSSAIGITTHVDATPEKQIARTRFARPGDVYLRVGSCLTPDSSLALAHPSRDRYVLVGILPGSPRRPAPPHGAPHPVGRLRAGIDQRLATGFGLTALAAAAGLACAGAATTGGTAALAT